MRPRFPYPDPPGFRGKESEVLIAKGSDKLANLVCEVEPRNLVTAHLSIPGVTLDGAGVLLDGDEFSDASYWMLKQILYFDAQRVATQGVRNKVNATC